MTDNLKYFVDEIPKIYADLLENRIGIDDLIDKSRQFQEYAEYVIDCETKEDSKALKKLSSTLKPFIMLCMDYYTYSANGDVLIPDRDYDMVMRAYVKVTGDNVISTADIIANSTVWPFRKHEAPFMVGTVAKIYDIPELKDALDKFKKYGFNKILYAPKFDGNSSVIKIESGQVTMAMTRNNGVEGQDITPLIQRSAATSNGFMRKLADGYYKTEVLVSRVGFSKIIDSGRSYANRRSAASAIVANPSNQDLAPFITVMPLAWCNFDGTRTEYLAAEWANGMLVHPDTSFDVQDVYENIESILEKIRDPEYPYRVDGVVLYPIRVGNFTPNTVDLMGYAVAYKINTKKAISRAKRVWIQVGRLGRVTPMLGVEPTEVNETIVKKASLSSIPKYESFHLHEGEKVVLFSAGDVIPQVEMPEIRDYPPGAPLFKMDMRCPYCGEYVKPMYKGAGVYKCKNLECPRVVTGRITNFAKTLGVKGISDKTIEQLYDAKVIQEFTDFIDLDDPEKVKKIRSIDGFGDTSTKLIVDTVSELKRKPTEASVFMGSLGIDQVKIKTCQLIMARVSFGKFIDMKPKEMRSLLLNTDGFDWTTADVIVEFMKEHRDEIQYLIHKMNITSDQEVRGNVVFTGFRNAKYAELFKSVGYPMSESVNKDTIAVVYVGDANSKKCQKARAKNIDVVHFGQIDYLLESLKKMH